MQAFTRQREKSCDDQVWVLEHESVYTLGQAGKLHHVLSAGDIPVVKVDRGGQVTYHGPGQLMFYVLLDLSRLGVGVRSLVEVLESSIINVMASYGIEAIGDRSAPGVYVGGKKIAAIGLRVSRGCSYHGLCFNYRFDAAPFLGINPCGYEGMQVTQLAELIDQLPPRREVIDAVIEQLVALLNYQNVEREQIADWRLLG